MRAWLGWPFFYREIFILKIMMFREVTTVLNERKYLEMVIRSDPDAVSLILGQDEWPGLAALHSAQKSTCCGIEHSSNTRATSWAIRWLWQWLHVSPDTLHSKPTWHNLNLMNTLLPVVGSGSGWLYMSVLCLYCMYVSVSTYICICMCMYVWVCMCLYVYVWKR